MRPDAEPTDLDESLTALSQLVLAGGDLEESLRRVAAMAAHAIPGADGVGLAMIEPDRRETVCASADFVRDVDTAQYDLEQGPCITAAAEARTVVAPDLGAAPEWPRFGPRAAALGVHSALSLPLVLGDAVVGALNVYARARDAFDATAVERGEVFAAAAAVTVHNVRQLAQAERLTVQLRAALTNRAVIDQAIGILMSRQGGTAEEAFDALKRMSQAENVKLAGIAQVLVDEAVKRARARRRDS